MTNKGSLLVAAEIDKNFYTIYDFLIELQQAADCAQYDSSATYTAGDTVKYNNKLYLQIYAGSPPEITGIPPTDEDYWFEISIGWLAHQKNFDTMLGKGTVNEVTAAEIRQLIDLGGSDSDTFITRAHPSITSDDIGKLASLAKYEFSGEAADVYAKVYERLDEEAGSPWEWLITVEDITQRAGYGKAFRFTGNLTDGDTITVRETLFWRNEQVFTFKNSVASPPAEDEILIGATLTETMSNAYATIQGFFDDNLLQNIVIAQLPSDNDGIDILSRFPQEWFEEGYTEGSDRQEYVDNAFFAECVSSVLRPVSDSNTRMRFAYTDENGNETIWGQEEWNHAGAPNGKYPATPDEEAENLMEFLDAEMNMSPPRFAFARLGNEITVTTIEDIFDDNSGFGDDETFELELESYAESITVEEVTAGEFALHERSGLQFAGTITAFDEENGLVTIAMPRFAQYTLDASTDVIVDNTETLIMVAKDGYTVGNPSTGKDVTLGLVGLAINNASAGERVWVVTDISIIQFLTFIGV